MLCYSDRLKGAVDIEFQILYVFENTKTDPRVLNMVMNEILKWKTLQEISPNNNVDKISVPIFVVLYNDPRFIH